MVNRMRTGTQILRKTGSHKNWLKPAIINMVLSMIWSLTSNSLHLHQNTKNHSPRTMTDIVIVPRLTMKGKKCAMTQLLTLPVPSSEQQEYSSHSLSYEIPQPIKTHNPILWEHSCLLSKSTFCLWTVYLPESVHFHSTSAHSCILSCRSQGPSLDSQSQGSQDMIFPSPPPLVTWRMKDRDYRSNLIIKQLTYI